MWARLWGRMVHLTGASEPSGSNAAHPAHAAVHGWANRLSRVAHRSPVRRRSAGRVR
jgi:hypothetical protein